MVLVRATYKREREKRLYVVGILLVPLLSCSCPFISLVSLLEDGQGVKGILLGELGLDLGDDVAEVGDVLSNVVSFLASFVWVGTGGWRAGLASSGYWEGRLTGLR